MKFNKHLELEGKHAVLSASKYHWVNYDDDRVKNVYMNYLNTQRGTELHALAADLIRLKVRMGKSKATINQYVNDCILHRMTIEQPLYYSENCYGTADAISYDLNNRLLKIFDLKTGSGPASFEQLKIYAALFYLEYHHLPEKNTTVLRIYQNDEVQELLPEWKDIKDIMTKIRRFSKIIDSMKEET